MKIKGVDVSKYQNGLTLKDFVKAGYKYAIIKCGGTLIKDGKTLYKESSFEKNYKEAKELNLPIGAFWYMCADSYEAGKREGEYCLKCLKGKKFEYPIYIDIEDPRYNTDRAKNDKAIKGFADVLEKAGWFVGINTFKYFALNKISRNVLNRYTQWIAYYSNNKPSMNTSSFDMWQYSSHEYINGIRYDADYCYRDFPAEIKSRGLNGYTKEKPVEKPIEKPAKKTKETIVKEVIQGKWGNGAERKKKLEAAGYNYNEIQKEVNKRLAVK